MEAERLKQEYSQKTDLELLALLKDPSLLRDEALPLLQQEIASRNISGLQSDQSDAPIYAKSGPRPLSQRLRWIGLWVLNTLNATVGVLVATGFINYSIRPVAGRAIERYLMRMPYCPLAIGVAFVAGYFAFRRTQGSYSNWVWILPAIGTAAAIASWKGANQVSWMSASKYFVEPLPYQEALRTQLPTASVLFASIAYSAGAWVRRRHDGPQKPSQIGIAS